MTYWKSQSFRTLTHWQKSGRAEIVQPVQGVYQALSKHTLGILENRFDLQWHSYDDRDGKIYIPLSAYVPSSQIIQISSLVEGMNLIPISGTVSRADNENMVFERGEITKNIIINKITAPEEFDEAQYLEDAYISLIPFSLVIPLITSRSTFFLPDDSSPSITGGILNGIQNYPAGSQRGAYWSETSSPLQLPSGDGFYPMYVTNLEVAIGPGFEQNGFLVATYNDVRILGSRWYNPIPYTANARPHGRFYINGYFFDWYIE